LEKHNAVVTGPA